MTGARDNPWFRSRHCVLRAAAGVPVAEAAASLFAHLARQLRDSGIEPLRETVYGPLADRDLVLRMRREALLRSGLDPELPCTYLAGRRDDDFGLAGLQLWGVVCDDPRVCVRTVRCRDGTAGRLLDAPGGRLLHLGALCATDASAPVSVQAEQMFASAERGLAEHGFGFPQVARTWIYLARLLDWYGEFNRVRTAFLRARGISGAAGGRPFPASTGIQGCGGAEECRMDLLAADGTGVHLQPVDGSRRQQRPIAYGSSFSRAMLLACPGETSMLVSGTASIDGGGQTQHCWQREAQVLETLLALASLLEEQGASLRDVVQATLFCKDRETLAAYERLTRQLGIAPLPAIPVLADVCRPELMVEIEALALVPQPAAARRTPREVPAEVEG